MRHASLHLATIFGFAVALPWVRTVAQEPAAKRSPLTLPLALKLGPDEITQYTDPSEAGQDRAARLYAEARRIETEHALAERDVALVIELDDWRRVLARCRNGSCSLAYLVNGGGTMYSHAAARNCASLEDFLSQLAPRLPFSKGKGDAKAAKQIEAAIAFVKKLKLPGAGRDKEARESHAALAAEVKRNVESWIELKGMVEEITAAEAVKMVRFAGDSLSWIQEGKSN